MADGDHANSPAFIGELIDDPIGPDPAIEDGERVYVGIDVGGPRAATALVYVTDDLRVGCSTWEGEEAVIYVEAAIMERQRSAGRGSATRAGAIPRTGLMQ